MGDLGAEYGNSSVGLPASCKCDHVQPVGFRQHCLQSREFTSAAQGEGFAHAYAVRLLNFSPLSRPDVRFAYYKQFRLDDGTVMQPPVVVHFHRDSPHFAWMRNHGCNQALTGTELDWLTFYSHLSRWSSSVFGMNDFRSAYRQTCAVNGVPRDCNDANYDLVSWNNTVAAVQAVWGFGSAKYNDWVAGGQGAGVNY